MIPQLIVLFIYFAGLLLDANRHGQDKKGTHNFWVSLVAHIIGISLLYWGGFFDVMIDR